jgi:D-sedoheptulose 7-phosphate isomerase
VSARGGGEDQDLTGLVRAAAEAHRSTVEASVEALLPGILKYGRLVAQTLGRGGKLLACGNGGSAAEAQHLVAELVGRFHRERRPLAALALTTDTSILTAVGNDYAYREVFARQVEALAVPGDVLLLISTSGSSENILAAAERGRGIGTVNIALTGRSGGKVASLADLTVRVPSDDTPRIQEVHLLIDHCVCEIVERLLGFDR